MVLQEKLRSIKMIKADSVTSYLSRFTQSHDELAALGEIVNPTVLVRTTLNGFSKPWENFVRGIVARETMPSWERLWDDFMQGELRHGSISTSQQQGVEMVMRVIFLFLQRERRRQDKVPKEGPSSSNREEKSKRRT
jgi:hypothetical protein